MISKPSTVVLDTNVLMKAAACKLILGTAHPSTFKVCWPQRVEESALSRTLVDRSERLHKVLQDNLSLVDDQIIDQADSLAAQFPKTHNDDVYVATSAAGVKADMLVTQNLKDFDSQELQAHGVALYSIDDFGLWVADNHIKRMLRMFDRNPLVRLENYLCTLEKEMPETIKKLRPHFAEELAELNRQLPFDHNQEPR